MKPLDQVSARMLVADYWRMQQRRGPSADHAPQRIPRANYQDEEEEVDLEDEELVVVPVRLPGADC